MNLEIKHISKSYGQKQALKDVTLQIQPGILGLLGPNGAGKSTLLRMLATIDSPTKGEIFWNGIDIIKYPNQLRKQLGYLPQDFGLYPNMNAIEFLEYIAAMKGLPMKGARNRIHELLDALHLSDDKKRKLGTYSGGMKQRVGIAQALLNDPKLLIVDEPTVGLDPVERMRFQNLLSSISATSVVILSTHIVSDIEAIATDIAILKNGSIIQFMKPQDLLNYVSNKVWEITVSTPFELNKLKENFIVSRAVHHPNGIQVRVISNMQPHSTAKATSASLEDGYLYFISSESEQYV